MATVALLLASPALAAPLTFTVNSNGDQADPDVGDGICDVGGDVCTLRAAIQEANANSPQADTINFGPITGQILLTSALPDLTDDVTINGPGADQLAIDGDNTYRVLTLQNGTTSTISGLTIQHGQAPVSGGTLAVAGGIESGGILTLDHVVVTDNHAAVTAPLNSSPESIGGGIDSGGTLTLTHSTVKSNDATANASGTGQAFANGGGMALEFGGTLHIDHSTIASNNATATVTSGSGNSTTRPSGGGIYQAGGTLTIDESTITNNSATGSGGTDPTIADFAEGGGIRQDNSSSLTVSGATISDNSVSVPPPPPPPNNEFGSGANVFLITGGTFQDTIVADPVGAANCAQSPPDFTSNGYNLEDDSGKSCNFGQPTDISGQNPMLAPLANNGGPTQTQALPANSPAIDQGKSFAATTDQRDTGFPRISDSPTIANATGGDGSDIGAFERDSVPPSATAPVQSLIKGSQLGTPTGVPVHFAWSASDTMTPGAQLKSFLQQRTNSSGTWSPFSTIVGPTLAKTATPSLSGSLLRQFRVQVKDQAGNFGTSPLGPAFRITTYQEGSPQIAYSGSWHHADQSTASGGGVEYSNQAGAKATLTSTGRNLAVVMPRRSTEGTVRICLDRGTPAQSCATVDLSPATGLGPRKEVFVRNGLSPTVTHKVEVTVLSGRADLDAFVALR